MDELDETQVWMEKRKGEDEINRRSSKWRGKKEQKNEYYEEEECEAKRNDSTRWSKGLEMRTNKKYTEEKKWRYVCKKTKGNYLEQQMKKERWKWESEGVNGEAKGWKVKGEGSRRIIGQRWQANKRKELKENKEEDLLQWVQRTKERQST